MLTIDVEQQLGRIYQMRSAKKLTLGEVLALLGGAGIILGPLLGFQTSEGLGVLFLALFLEYWQGQGLHFRSSASMKGKKENEMFTKNDEVAPRPQLEGIEYKTLAFGERTRLRSRKIHLMSNVLKNT